MTLSDVQGLDALFPLRRLRLRLLLRVLRGPHG